MKWAQEEQKTAKLGDIYCSSLYLKTRVVGGKSADGIVVFINNKRVKVD